MGVFVSKKTYKKRLTKKDIQKRIGGSDTRQDGKRAKRRTNGARSAPNLRRATARGARQGYIVPKKVRVKRLTKKDVFFLKDLQKRLTKKDLQKTLLFVS